LKIEIPFPGLDMPEPPLQLREEADQIFYFDIWRSKWLLLSPEEWVRQHVLFWLISQTGWPVELLAVERSVKGSRQRSDIVGYNRLGAPALLVECKAPEMPVDEETARQAIQYNQKLNCPYLWLSNGRHHRVFRVEKEGYETLDILPGFHEIIPLS
jgi:hypothetical protein